jgi:hypothetical protein
MKRDPSRKLDPETMLALEKRARQRKDRRAVSYLIAVVIVLLVLGLIYWLMKPGEAERFILAAYDAVDSPGEEIELHARLEPAGGAVMKEKQDLRFQLNATQTDEWKASEAGSAAAIQWKAPLGKSQVLEFIVRHQNTNNAKNVDRDQGKVFIWPNDSKMLIVDVDHALTEGTDGLAGNAAPVLRPGSAAVLKHLALKYKIVYVSSGAETPSRYKKLRSWLSQQQVPPGPLLAPTSSDSGNAESFTADQIKQLKNRFSSPALAVVGRASEAQASLDAGWKTVVLGDAKDSPVGVISIATWSELPKE